MSQPLKSDDVDDMVVISNDFKRTKHPILFCKPCGKPTQHHWLIERRANVSNAVEQIYACEGCPSERRWGLLG